MTYQFDDETALEAIDATHWQTHLTSNWNIGENPNGGYLLAPLLRAMASVSGHSDPLTVTTHYLRPGTADAAADIEVEPIRVGRTLGTVRGRLGQGGETRLESMAAFTDLTDNTSVADIKTPLVSIPPPEECVSRTALAQGVVLPITERLDIRIHPEHVITEVSREPEMTGWIRFADGRPVDALALTLFADAFPPPLFAKVGRIGWVPTIELTVHVRRRPVEGWIRGHFRTADAAGNRTIEDGWLWDEAGDLVAVARQVGLVLSAQPQLDAAKPDAPKSAHHMSSESSFAPGLFTGKTALVTGGGTGLGRAIAEQFASLGADVVIAARRDEVLRQAAAEILEATGNEVTVELVDIKNLESVEALAERHTVDILVNNAGGQFPQKSRDFSPNGWKSVIDLNLNGTWTMTQVFGNQMLDGDGGVIVQIVAIVGRGLPGMAHSAAAHAGVIEMTHTIAFEWGPKVRINCVAPGAFHTQGWEDAYDPEVGQDMSGVPLPYPGRPSDIANAVTFLASPAASYMTGQTLYVDGGYALHGPISALPPGGYPERALRRPRT